MKTLYIQCSMGVAGDMLMGALYELVEDKEGFLDKFNKLGIPGLAIEPEGREKCGINGTHMHVWINGEEEGAEDNHHHHHHHDYHHDHGHEHHHHDHDQHHEHHHHDHHHEHEHEHHHHEHHHHSHNSLTHIMEMIDGLDLSDQVKANAKAIYQIIGKAESQVHGVEMENIHFHEVGTLDAVADVIGNCLLIEAIGADRIIVSPIHAGSGTVKCAHGILPVPAPATALILQGVPYYTGDIQGELCTPTGASLVKYFADGFGSMPTMTVEKIGYGMGNKDFKEANCVRVMLGESWDESKACEGTHENGQIKDDGRTKGDGQVVELACNLDDMSGEGIGFAMERLLEEGALDVYTQPITMKKSRPAIKLVCMARPEDEEKMAELILRYTTSIGVRVYRCDRYELKRSFIQKETPWGPVQVKTCHGYGVSKEKAEYEDLAEIAREQGITIEEVRSKIGD